jgi:hypothetical protein
MELAISVEEVTPSLLRRCEMLVARQLLVPISSIKIILSAGSVLFMLEISGDGVN